MLLPKIQQTEIILNDESLYLYIARHVTITTWFSEITTCLVHNIQRLVFYERKVANDRMKRKTAMRERERERKLRNEGGGLAVQWQRNAPLARRSEQPCPLHSRAKLAELIKLVMICRIHHRLCDTTCMTCA